MFLDQINQVFQSHAVYYSNFSRIQLLPLQSWSLVVFKLHRREWDKAGEGGVTFPTWMAKIAPPGYLWGICLLSISQKCSSVESCWFVSHLISAAGCMLLGGSDARWVWRSKWMSIMRTNSFICMITIIQVHLYDIRGTALSDLTSWGNQSYLSYVCSHALETLQVQFSTGIS